MFVWALPGLLKRTQSEHLHEHRSLSIRFFGGVCQSEHLHEHGSLSIRFSRFRLDSSGSWELHVLADNGGPNRKGPPTFANTGR